MAIEIALQNFIQGKILVVNTGYYSERLKIILNFLKQNFGKIKKIETVSWEKIKFIKKKYDWICACPVETSVGLKIPIKELYSLKKKSKSKLMLDATGSIGLESGHKYADVATFSSCKGLFGLTGAAFISYKTKPLKNIKSFYMNINTHIKKKLTGPYHTIGSLYYVLKNHSIIKKTVIKNKLKFIKDNKEFLIYSKKNQPNLCTYLKINIKKNNKNVILYTSRKKTKGSVVSHLGETYLKSSSKGEIQKYLIK